jgi:hypothetical protein
MPRAKNLRRSSPDTSRQAGTPLEKCYRCVILAAAGVGKTHEMKTRAVQVRESGRASFFIRIEDIDQDFELAFEVGDAVDFQRWLSSTDEAWFFLDSVDEARLGDVRAFEKAIRRFASRIKSAQHRARIVVSSRPYAWRSQSDYSMLCGLLPFDRPKDQPKEQDAIDAFIASKDNEAEEKNALDVYVLDDLTEDAIRAFATHRGAEKVDRLVEEIRRKNLLAVAGRPFDLEGIIEKWKDDGALGSRLEVLSHGIDKRLSEIDPGRAQQQPLNRERARAGARSLAAAVVLTGEAGIRVPDEQPSQNGIDAEIVLGDWDPRDVNTLLGRGIFDDVIYGLVRFRHREVRELLAAEWLADHLRKGSSRSAVEALLFREIYGQRFITPRLRPLLPWLILLDDDIRRKAVVINPEIVIEGGDVAKLSLPERRKLLQDIVRRIAANEDPRSARDNEAIARIAQADLSDDVLRLIQEHQDNDTTLFFLGRLVWQGELAGCLAAMMSVATSHERGLYARIAAIRSVMCIGTRQQSDALWDALLAHDGTIDRRIFAEIVQHAAPDQATVSRVLASIEKLPPHKRFQASGLTEALHQFIGRFNLDISSDKDAVARLVQGLNGYLDRRPHLEGGRVQLSRDFSWLLSVAADAVERLVAARAECAFSAEVVGVFEKVSAAKFWHQDVDLREYSERLSDRVGEWTELRDALFWKGVESERAHSLATTGEPVTDAWRVLFNFPFCHFDTIDFDRVVAFIDQRPLEDDKLVGVSLAHQLVKEIDPSTDAMAALKATVMGQEALEQRLERLVAAQPSKEHRAMEARAAKHRLDRERKQRIEAEYRRRWVTALQANPDLVRRPRSVEPGAMTNHQNWLMAETQRGDSNRWKGDDWRSLLATFGQNVAEAYRDTAMAHWREFTPPLLSEGYFGEGTPTTLIFGLAGLEIEASEAADFPGNLSEEELRLAMRYTTWELNGFPTWLEAAYRHRPDIVMDAILAELRWDLARSEAPRSHILHDVVYHAPWLHKDISRWLIEWLETNAARDPDTLRQALSIAKTGVSGDRLTTLARAKVAHQAPIPEQAEWFALWVDTDAETGIPALRAWLDTLSPEEATLAAQHVVTDLVGDRRGAHLRSSFESYRNAGDLKRLYVLMHQHIRVADDIDRAGGGVFSPGLRDDAQDARNSLLNLLAELPGKSTYVALNELSEDHPNQTARAWMAAQAFGRAEQDGDIEAWSPAQVREFDASQTLTPATNQQLFDLTVNRLVDMRAWLERGDDSPYVTWRRVPVETEMRNLVAGRLNENSLGRYSCAQENEMPNGQRPDIWVQSPSVPAPVPIELKLLDNGWSGPSLCERLRNQLAGDYLRAEAAGAGVMLLIWQGRKNERVWKISGKRVPLDDLEVALQAYWHSIAGAWPDVREVRVIVADLTKRGLVSKT